MVQPKIASNTEWKVWGRLDPLWGVASWPGRERDGATPWTDEEFYALGSDWHDFDSAWRKCGRDGSGTVLEIGCGAGRMTRMLSGTFANVIATDVSEDMITYGRARVNQENVEWRVSNGAALPADDGSVDAVFSCHVLQHFPSNAAQLQNFAEMHRILRTGGSIFVHIPMHAFPESNASFRRFARAAYATYLKVGKAAIALRKLKMIMGGRPFMRGTSYEMQRLIDDVGKLGFRDVSVSMVNVGDARVVHPCIYGRKA
jgi:SAM-dependent methyltransferase